MNVFVEVEMEEVDLSSRAWELRRVVGKMGKKGRFKSEDSL